MARLLARTAPAGLWFLAAATSAAAEPAASGQRFIESLDLASTSLGELADADAAEADSAGANSTNETQRLQAKIAWLKGELQHEAWRIESARREGAEANATRRAKEEELEHVRAETANATERARHAWREVAEVQAQIKEVEDSEGQGEGPVVAWIAKLPHQQALAILLGTAGLLSIVGPSTFTRAFLAISGSAVGGLLVASCCTFFLEGTTWLSSVRSLLKGTAQLVGYGLWAVIFVAGVLRWLLGGRCGKASEDEAGDSSPSRAARAGESSLQRPLLASEAPSSARRGAPAAPPSSGRQRGARPGGAPRGGVARDAV